MIRVLIADDHPIVREGLRGVLTSTDDVVVVAEAGSGPEVLERAQRVDCDVILLDLSMPGSDGLDVLKELRRLRSKIPVLVLTMHSEDQFAVRSLRAGAAGYLTKDSAPAELIGAIRKIVAGGRYFRTSVAERLIDHIGHSERAARDLLSDREYQVLRLLTAGKTTREIGRALSVSPKTVATYRARMCEKLQVRTVAELAAFAIRNHILD